MGLIGDFVPILFLQDQKINVVPQPHVTYRGLRVELICSISIDFGVNNRRYY